MKDLSEIEEIYHQALQFQTAAERERFLRESCGDDGELRREIDSLLSFDEPAQNFIESPPEDLAASFLNRVSTNNLIGQTFNQYRIIERLGEGGMGEVFLAEDTKLERKAALKLLPPQYADSPERKRLFEKEARAVSALNHPNILTIFSVEQNEQYNFIATEFVDGQTLSEKIRENKLSAREIIDIALQIADALNAAHSVGIIHRDIKPANIIIRRDGYAKILDFGLAKLIQTRDAESEKQNENDGVFAQSSEKNGQVAAPNENLSGVMGTVNYMSPEQASGLPVDARSDIFSFGVVFYEMLAGSQPFGGETNSEISEARINKNPPLLEKLKPEIPPKLSRIVARAIEKKPENRYQTIAELSRDLRKVKQSFESESSDKTSPSKQKPRPSKLFIMLVTTLIVAATVYFLFVNRVTPNQTAPPKNFIYTQLTSQSGEELFPNLSPDGKSLLYSGRAGEKFDIFLQRIDGSDTANLTANSKSDNKQAVFSPDGLRIAFRSDRDGGGIFIMDADGKNVRRISDGGFYPNWSPDAKEIVSCKYDFVQPGERPDMPSELWRINVETGDRQTVIKQDAVQPNWSPNGKWIAFWGLRGVQRDIWITSANGGAEPISITDDAANDWNPIWSPDGKYLYFASDRNGSMNFWRVAIDEDSGKVSGNPEAVTVPSSYSQFFSFGRQGNFVFAQSSIDLNLWRADFDSVNETVNKIIQITTDTRIKTDPSISPDEKSMVFASVGSQNEDIYLANSDGGNIRLLTNTAYKERLPVWSPDGQKIAFLSNESGKVFEGWIMNPDGSSLRKITTDTTPSAIIPVWSPDGKSLLFSVTKTFPLIFDPDKNSDQQTPTPLPAEKGKISFMATSWSTDGRKLAGWTTDTDSAKQHITIYDFTSQQYRDLTNIGGFAVWLADNRRLVFCSEDKIFLLDTQTKKLKELLSVKPNIIDSIAITKDNGAIYYSVKKRESDIWLADNQ